MNTERIINQVRAGKLKFTPTNDHKVQNAFGDLLYWKYLFEEAGLGSLPDPERTYTEGISLLEQWIENCHVALTDQPLDEIRAAMSRFRETVREMARSS